MTFLLRNIPNFLTALRLAASPALAALLWRGHDYAALIVFAIAGATDALDGYLAKRFNLQSRFGRYMDPAADKLLMLTSFLALTVLGVTPVWLTALVIARDAAIVLGIGLAHLLSLPLRATPSLLGKVSTAVQVTYVGVMLLLLTFDIHAPVLINFAQIAVAAFTLASGLGYAQIWLRAATHARRTA
ncbi:MAG: CDP-alcohol phosphatidyltransferase family protein [Proteobacteria bacterium]|nr:CDP-alcohol phosphatidyltransferase family protein [Pseudomonadota bacterium]